MNLYCRILIRLLCLHPLMVQACVLNSYWSVETKSLVVAFFALFFFFNLSSLLPEYHFHLLPFHRNEIALISRIALTLPLLDF